MFALLLLFLESKCWFYEALLFCKKSWKFQLKLLEENEGWELHGFEPWALKHASLSCIDEWKSIIEPLCTINLLSYDIIHFENIQIELYLISSTKKLMIQMNYSSS